MISAGLRSVSGCVNVYTSPAVIDLEGSGSLRSVSKEGQARAKPGAFGRPGFKGCYHFFCQIQQSPVLWLASCLVRTLCFFFHSHSLRWDSISLKRYRRTWWTVSRVVAEDVRMGTWFVQDKSWKPLRIEYDTRQVIWTNVIFSKPQKKTQRDQVHIKIYLNFSLFTITKKH